MFLEDQAYENTFGLSSHILQDEDEDCEFRSWLDKYYSRRSPTVADVVPAQFSLDMQA